MLHRRHFTVFLILILTVITPNVRADYGKALSDGVKIMGIIVLAGGVVTGAAVVGISWSLEELNDNEIDKANITISPAFHEKLVVELEESDLSMDDLQLVMAQGGTTDEMIAKLGHGPVVKKFFEELNKVSIVVGED